MADLQDIVDDLEAEIRRPISVEDRRWRLLAHSAQPDETDPVRRQSILSRETPPDVVAWLEGLGLQRARELVDVPANDALGMTRRGCLPIRHGDVLLGFLWVIVGDNPLTDDERAALARGGREAPRTCGGACARPTSADAASQSLLRALLARRGRRGRARRGLALARDGHVRGRGLRGRRRGRRAPAPPPRRRRLRVDSEADAARDPRPRPDGLPAAPGVAAGATGGVSARFSSLDDAPAALRQAEVAALVHAGAPGVRTGRGVRPSSAAGRSSPSCGATPAGRSRRSGSSSSPPTAAETSWSRRSKGCSRPAATSPRPPARSTCTARRSTAASNASRRSPGFDLSRGDDRLLAHLGLRLYRLG